MRLLVILLFTSSFIFAQDANINAKKGVAIYGYDVVSYFNSKPLKGNSKFSVNHNGVEYRFASKENKTIFSSNPKKYLPQYGGYCAYAIALKSKKVKVDPETYQIKDNKLYLFYNAWGTNTLDLWNKENVKGLIQKGDQNWETLKKEN